MEPGTTYAYSVSANSAQGASPSSESASAEVPDAPSAPGNLTGAIAEPESTDETATVNLTWTASTVPTPDQCDVAYPLTGYTIVRSGYTRPGPPSREKELSWNQKNKSAPTRQKCRAVSAEHLRTT